MAHVKSGGGKQKNGRDSNPKMLGVKRFAGQKVTRARSSSVSGGPESIPAAMLARAAMTLCSL
jgi:hypothetical protein